MDTLELIKGRGAEMGQGDCGVGAGVGVTDVETHIGFVCCARGSVMGVGGEGWRRRCTCKCRCCWGLVAKKLL